MDRDPFALLKTVYQPQAIFLTGITKYSKAGLSVRGTFIIPASAMYTSIDVEYVGAEQYIRCINQLAYVLITWLVEDRAIAFDKCRLSTLVDMNRLLDRSHKLKYKMTPKDASFMMELAIIHFTIVRDKFAVCVMSAKGPAYGVVEFVAPLNNLSPFTASGS